MHNLLRNGRLLLCRSFTVTFSSTPNPLCLKAIPDREIPSIVPGSEYRSLSEAKDNSLCKSLLELKGIQKLMFGNNFISVTKRETADWEELKPKISGIIENYINSGKFEESSKPKTEQNTSEAPDLEAVSMIKELIEFRIRPMLLDDGGDIQYRGFNTKTGVLFKRKKAQIVYVTLKGACEGCPSNASTLKEGIERLLSFYVVEVGGVENIEADAEIPK